MTEHTSLAVPAPIPYSDIERMANAMVKSNLFGMKTIEQAVALMLIAQAEGLHPAQAAREYHIIQGRPALTAEAMLSRFQRAGGKVKWTTYTAQEVTGEFSHPSGGTLVVTWNMQRAKQAQLTGKDNWNKYPEAMLASRCISEGVRRVCPGAVLGVYTPEETEDFTPPDDDLAAAVEAEGGRISTTEERREQRQQQEKANLAAKGEVKKDVKLTMLGRGETVVGQQGRKDHVGFWVVVRSAEKFIRYYSPQQFGERVKLAGDPDNVLTPHKHCGPIICDLTAEADGSGGYNYVASNLRVLPVEGMAVPPIEPEVLTVHDLDVPGTLEILKGGK